MNEHESDILIAETEEELQTEKQDDSLFEYDNSQPTYEFDFSKNKTIQKEADSFVNYSSNNLNKVYKKYNVVQTYIPKKEKQKKSKDFDNFVKEQSEYVPERETIAVERVEEKNKFKFKNSVKAWLVAIAIIFSMLGGLSIYNAVNINNINNQITETTVNLNNVNNDIKKVISNIDELTDEDNVLQNARELGLKEVTEENKVNIELLEKNNVEDYKGQTNFFDKICNFFRNLFGG